MLVAIVHAVRCTALCDEASPLSFFEPPLAHQSGHKSFMLRKKLSITVELCVGSCASTTYPAAFRFPTKARTTLALPTLRG